MLKRILSPVVITNCLRVQAKRYAGHSKWANIKHTKGLKDAQRAALFTKLGRQIKVAIAEGGSIDPKKNLKLEQVIEQTRRVNMPAATVQSVIKSQQMDKKQCKLYTIEIKGPGGCIILCDVFTDNLHGLKQIMATILKKHSSRYSDGGGKHLFEQKGLVQAELPDASSENLLETATDNAIEAGAEDVTVIGDTNQLEFVCGATSLQPVVQGLERLGYKISSAEVEYTPLKGLVLNDDDLETCSSLFDKLEAQQEVIKLHSNIA